MFNDNSLEKGREKYGLLKNTDQKQWEAIIMEKLGRSGFSRYDIYPFDQHMDDNFVKAKRNLLSQGKIKECQFRTKTGWAQGQWIQGYRLSSFTGDSNIEIK
jgi:hypothetical protein